MGYQQGSGNLLDAFMGQNSGKATPNTIGMLPDDDAAAAVAEAQAKYDAEHKVYETNANAAVGDYLKNLGQSGTNIWGQMAAPVNAIINAPAPVDVAEIQANQDRRRLLALAMSAYQPAISDLLSASRGEGPSAALNYYREAADDAARRNYGVAASAQGTGGQRAALFQAAMGQDALDRQKGANKAAIVGAEEQNQARSSLNSTLSGLTNLYGNILYSGTQHNQDQNQDAANRADEINAGIAANNAKNKGEFVGDLAEAGGRTLAGAATGGSSEALRAAANLPKK